MAAAEFLAPISCVVEDLQCLFTLISNGVDRVSDIIPYLQLEHGGTLQVACGPAISQLYAENAAAWAFKGHLL